MATAFASVYGSVRNWVLPPDWHQLPTPFLGCSLPNSIFIVDDNSDIRAGIRRQLEISGFDVCGEAGDGIDALDKLSRVKPDLIILDMSMPRMERSRCGPRAQACLSKRAGDFVHCIR